MAPMNGHPLLIDDQSAYVKKLPTVCSHPFVTAMELNEFVCGLDAKAGNRCQVIAARQQAHIEKLNQFEDNERLELSRM